MTDVPEYFVFRQDRHPRGGGVAILVKKCLNPELVGSYSAMGTEAIVVDIHFAERVLRVVNVYRPTHSADIKPLLSFVESHLKSPKDTIIVVTGIFLWLTGITLDVKKPSF